ncbi:MAG: hypothetical protein JWM64_1510 [Frankiales bacterium]|nr:hypothetical protein [Frankiales bacterium]
MSTPTPDAHPRQPATDAVVHLQLRDGVGGHELRERMVPSLAGEVTDVRVHVGEAVELDGDVLRSLGAAAAVLEARGGALTVVGAGERLRTRLWLHGIARLVAEEREPSQARDGSGRASGTG